MKSHGEFFADKLMDLANLAAAALVFGQVLSEHVYPEAFVIGLSFFGLCAIISFQLRERRNGT